MPNMINDVSKKICNILEINDQQGAVIKYGITLILSNLVGIVGVLTVACLSGVFYPTLVVMVTLVLLRPAAGGAHCANSLSCNIFGIIFIPLLGYLVTMLARLPVSIQYIYLVAMTALAICGIAVNAPYFVQSKPRAENRRKALKMYSIIMVFLLLVAAVILLQNKASYCGIGIATGLLFQGSMLLPFGIKGTLFLDNLLSKVILRREGD